MLLLLLLQLQLYKLCLVYVFAFVFFSGLTVFAPAAAEAIVCVWLFHTYFSPLWWLSASLCVHISRFLVCGKEILLFLCVVVEYISAQGKNYLWPHTMQCGSLLLFSFFRRHSCQRERERDRVRFQSFSLYCQIQADFI